MYLHYSAVSYAVAPVVRVVFIQAGVHFGDTERPERDTASEVGDNRDKRYQSPSPLALAGHIDIMKNLSLACLTMQHREYQKPHPCPRHVGPSVNDSVARFTSSTELGFYSMSSSDRKRLLFLLETHSCSRKIPEFLPRCTNLVFTSGII